MDKLSEDKRSESKIAGSKNAARQDGSGMDGRHEAWEEIAGRCRGRPLTEWLIQTRQAEVAARNAVYARLARGEQGM